MTAVLPMLRRDNEVVIVVAKWLPRYGHDWYLFAEVGVLAVSRALYDSGEFGAVLGEADIRRARLREGDRPILRVTCPLCGRDDPPMPDRRPTVDDLGLLPRHHR